MKRYKKVFIMSLLSIFALAAPVFAREMTIEELGTEATKQVPNTSYVYIIGEYAFTSEHTLTTQDVMLATRSIKVEDETGKTNEDNIYNEMTIFTVEGNYDDSAQFTGWQKGNNVIGTSQLGDNVNIRYIDYNYVKDLFKVEFELGGGEFKDKKTFIKVEENGTINENDITGENRPTLQGKQFKEWVLVKEEGQEEKWDFSKPVTGNMKLKATWYEEVNTDKLLEDAQSKIIKNDFYGVAFDKENKKLTFNVYDLNKKNSEIASTGLIADIVNIVKEENVVSIAISNGTENVVFDSDDVDDGTGPDSAAWSQFGQLLTKLTKKPSFEEVTLGDLVAIQEELTLTITVDTDKARSQNNNVSEDYKVEFSYNAGAKIAVPSESEDFTDFNYTLQNTYEINGKDGLYNVTGYITEQEGVTGFGDGTSGFYFAYTISLDEGINANNAKVKVPTDETETKYNEEIFDPTTKTVTVLMEVKESEVGDNAQNGYRDIIVEVDGVPTKIRIDFSELKLRKSSKFEIQDAKDNQNLQSNYGWTKPNDYDVEFSGTTINENNNLVKVTGLLPIYNNTFNTENLFGKDHETGYYIAFAIKTKNNKDENKTTVVIKDGEETISATGTNFDDETTLYVLKHLHPEKNSRTFTIEVDMDGTETNYNLYTITVDWSELKLQTESKAKIELSKAPEADKKQMENWGYKSPDGQEVTLVDGMLKGKLIEQTLTSEVAFGAENKDGFFFDFTIQHPEGVELNENEIEITRVKSHKDIDTDLQDTNIIKKFTSKDLDENKDLTILYRFPKDTTSCTKCAGKQTCDSDCCGENGICDKVLYYIVDWDGKDGKEYLPVVYSIDYCGVTFEKSSIFTVTSLPENDKDKFPFDDNNAWYDTEKGYSVKVDQDKTDASKYKVTGVLPIFDDESDSEYGDHFDTKNENLYYLGLLLNLVSADNIQYSATDTINVKFFHNGEDDDQFMKVYDTDFNSTNELYILKALTEAADDGSTIPDDQKVFTIELDLDNEGIEYVPYTVTIDWSGLKLQDTSRGNFGNYEVATQTNISEDQGATEFLKSCGYNFETSKEVTLKTETMPEHGEVKRGLKGTIKEQNLKSGFEDNNGYFVPIKVEFPGNDIPQLAEYKDKWTIILNTEDGETKEYVPTEEEYKQGWVLVLFRIEKNGKAGDGKTIKYKIDFDGTQNYAFIPEEYTIDYSELNFAEAHKITFKGVEAEPITVWDGDKLTEEMLPEGPNANDDYHEFAYWNKEDGTKFDSIEFTYEGNKQAGDKETGDIELVPHWNLYSDKFISDVLEDLNSTDTKNSQDFSEEFKIEKYEENSGEVTITVIDPTTKLSRMNDTSIPGTIAYILLKDEIQEITLSVNGNNKIFEKGEATDKDTLKDTIKAGAKELYADILRENFDGKNDETVTLSDLANKEKYESFTLKFNPEKVAKTVTLTKVPEGANISLASSLDVPTNYEFTFKSDTIIVKTQKELQDALNSKAKHILIDGDFNVTSPISVEREVVIEGNNQHTLTADSNANTIFDVKSTGITIDNITLANAKTPIVVTNGSLKSTGITVNGQTTETAFDVKDGAALTVSQLTYENETYEKPAVRASKSAENITLTDSTSKTAKQIEKEKITKYENQQPKSNLGDEKETDSTYNYYNYYNKEKNSKIYKTTFHNYEGRSLATFVRYSYYGENVQPFKESPFTVFDKFSYDGYTYTLIGFAKTRDNTVDRNYNGSLKDGVISPDNLKATSDESYYAAYKVELPENVSKVTTKEEFKRALDNAGIKEIYIDSNLSEIDLRDEDITISRSLSIIGLNKVKNVKLKVKSIKSTADDVFLHRLDIEVDPQQGESLIDISNSNKFTLWQSSLKNISQSVKVNSAIKCSGEKALLDIRWNTFSADNINDTLINVDTGLAGKTDIYGNTFKGIASLDTTKKSAITIKTFDDSAKMTDDDEIIRIAANTFDDNNYAIKILEEASDKEADISLKTIKEIEIGVRYSADKNQFGKIRIHHTEDVNKIKIKYIDESGIEKDTLEGGTQVSIISQVVMGDSGAAGNAVPEAATIDGLKLSGDTYSGVISQSEDGKFYLPVTLTSNDFEDRVSTVKVTNPNGEEKIYTYSSSSKDGIMAVSNANTMNLQLEAIKSSKITGNNGKVYKLELDADGAKSDDYDVKEYTINYSGVDTLAEIINKAAEKTQKANSLTLIRDNKIKEVISKDTTMYDKQTGRRLVKITDGNKESYTFNKKEVDLAAADTTKINVEKNIPTDYKDCPTLGDWRYNNKFTKIGYGVFELELLRDITTKKQDESDEYVEAIKTIEKTSDNTYKIIINKERLDKWLNTNYVDFDNIKTTDSQYISDTDTIKLEVKLSKDEYISSIKTLNNFSIKGSSLTTTDNKIDIKILGINETIVESPSKVILEKEESQETKTELKKFIEDGIAWWSKHSGSEQAN